MQTMWDWCAHCEVHTVVEARFPRGSRTIGQALRTTLSATHRMSTDCVECEKRTVRCVLSGSGAMDMDRRSWDRKASSAGSLDLALSRLRDAAALQGRSLRSLARCAHLSHSTVSRVWRGELRPSDHVVHALEKCLEAGHGGALDTHRPGESSGRACGPGDGSSKARPHRTAAGPSSFPLPPGVTQGELLSVLDDLTRMATGPEVRGMLRVGFEAKRAQLAQAGLIGPMLTRLDRLYGIYVESPERALPERLMTRIGACLLYFVLSADQVPDDVLPMGYLDDAWVVDRVWRELQALGLGDLLPGPND